MDYLACIKQPHVDIHKTVRKMRMRILTFSEARTLAVLVSEQTLACVYKIAVFFYAHHLCK